MWDMLSWLPENVSTYGGEIDSLFYIIYYITGGAFLLVAFAMIAFVIMFRHREGRRATYLHGNTAIEITWTIVTAVIFVVTPDGRLSRYLYGILADYVERLTAKGIRADGNIDIIGSAPQQRIAYESADDERGDIFFREKPADFV